MSVTSTTRKTLTHTLIEYVPFKRSLLLIASRLPNQLKGSLFQRFFAQLLYHTNNAHELKFSTNFGLDSNYRISTDISAGPKLLFGKLQNNEWERGSITLCGELAKYCDSFCDIGAYVGMYCFYMESLFGNSKRIFAFEPNPNRYHQLKENINKNLCHTTALNQAVGKEEGKAIFYIDSSDDSYSSLKPIGEGRSEKTEVEITTLNKLITENNLNKVLLKVDVEGAERDVIEGMKNSKDQLSYMIIEILHESQLNGFIPYAKKELGMHAYYINDYLLEHSENGEFTYSPPHTNWLFCRHSAQELASLLENTPFIIKKGHKLLS